MRDKGKFWVRYKSRSGPTFTSINKALPNGWFLVNGWQDLYAVTTREHAEQLCDSMRKCHGTTHKYEIVRIS